MTRSETLPEVLPFAPRFGPRWDGSGVRFNLPAPRAERVEICFFAPDGLEEVRRRDLDRADDGVWTLDAPAARPGDLYGYRVHGPFDPRTGNRFDPAKLLIDPAARAISGRVVWSRAIHTLDPDGSGSRRRRNRDDSAPFVPRSRVVDSAFDWRGDAAPETPWRRSLIYECHVRGATYRHPEVPPVLRGTYLGLAHPAFVEHLQQLGVTAVELMPVQHFTPERHLALQGRPNYWGYSPLAFYAPHAGYATADDGAQVDEFKAMVRALHAAGIEVLIDVVFNHTCEGDLHGPSLALRGVDHRSFYRIDEATGRPIDTTGCGNTLAFGGDLVDSFVLDCLRSWATEFRVDGFRFDLAVTVGRDASGAAMEGSLLEAIGDDPILAGKKLIAEPWDLGPDGYQLGRFPKPWREWNDRFRDTARAFWRGDDGQGDELVRRLAGSPDLTQGSNRKLWSIDYLASHDGYTLSDLVTYEERHNHGNGEENRDGHRHNLSRNWGVEGETDDSEIVARRRSALLNLLTTLYASDGVAMLGHGDELGRTQRGNNNAYCQDSPLTWIDWELTPNDRELLEATRTLGRLRRRLTTEEGEPWAPLPTADPEVDGLVALWRPADGFLLILHAGEADAELELPFTAWSWSPLWTTVEGYPSPDGERMTVPPYSAALFARDAGPDSD